MFFPHQCPTIVLAPHPDDEVLGCGGLIYRLRKMDIKVQVVLATGTEERVKESISAGQVLGLQETDYLHLGLEEGGIRNRDHSSSSMLASKVQQLRNEFPKVQILLPFRWDGHKDHEDLYWMAAFVLGPRYQEKDGGQLLVYEYPIWVRNTLGWRRLGPEKSFDFTRSIRLTQEEKEAKQKATMQFQSQLPSLRQVARGEFLDGLIGGDYEYFRPTRVW
jgi:LmbE family N-acetylglucosaminyl deacetylase